MTFPKLPIRIRATSLIIATAFVATGLAQTASAQSMETIYANANGWIVRSESENGSFLGCYAESINANAQAGFGSIMRIAMTADQQWYLATDFEVPSSQQTTIVLDRSQFQTEFRSNGTGWSIAQLGPDLRHAIAAGSQINLYLDPEGPQFSLSGSGAALNMVSQCRASQGREPQRPVAQQPSGPSVIKAPQKAAGCTDGGARLPATGLCQDEATRLINAVGGFELTYDPARCTAAINETVIVDQFLLYSAMRCDGVTSKLDFAGGARFSSLEISASAMNGSSANGIPVVTIGGLHDNDAEATIFDYVADVMEPSDARGTCYVQSGRDYGYPNDSYVVNDQPYKPNAEQFELGARCGKWGYFDDAHSFWRAFGGYTWFFDFGQDPVEFDTQSFTLIEKDANGGWRVVH